MRPKPLGGSGQSAFQLPLEKEGGLEEWRAARAVCEELGLWPLISPDADYGSWGRSPVEPHEPTTTVIQRARERPWPDDVPLAVVGPEDWARWVAGDIENTRYGYGDGPALEDVLAVVPRPDRLALERVLFDWEEQARPTGNARRAGVFDFPGTLQGEDLQLVLLPLPEPWMLPGYVDIYVAGYDYGPQLGCIGVERLAAAMKSWQERYGAEPYAVGALTLRFHVTRPPLTTSTKRSSSPASSINSTGRRARSGSSRATCSDRISGICTTGPERSRGCTSGGRADSPGTDRPGREL